MKRKYYIHRWADFGNTYDLCAVCDSTDEQAIADAIDEGQDWQRISRAECRRLLAEERARRKYDPAFSGYAPKALYPAHLALDPTFAPSSYYGYNQRITL